MGGAIETRGNLIVQGFTDDLQNKVAEWNIYIDPVAANKVFTSGIPITLIPLDATNQVPVTLDFTAEFKRKATSPEAKFIDIAFLTAKVISSNRENTTSGIR